MERLSAPFKEMLSLRRPHATRPLLVHLLSLVPLPPEGHAEPIRIVFRGVCPDG
jgi:hypothetical protein